MNIPHQNTFKSDFEKESGCIPSFFSQFLFLIIAVSGVTVCVVSSVQAQDTTQPVNCKRNVLGYCIQCGEEESDRCRLLNEDGDVLGKGSIEDVRKKLGAKLKERYGTGNPNLPFWTLGGMQFWADGYVLAGWRIQENVFTGHHRLLDPNNVRRAWGDYRACRAVFESIRARKSIAPRSSHWVILLHGFLRSAKSMEPMRAELENAGYEVVSVNYPSSRRGIPEHARQLATVLNRAEDDASTVSFVTHSMGGIVLRTLLTLDQPWRNEIQLGRIVMIAPPSHGSELAEQLDGWYTARLIAGPGLEDLSPEDVNKLPYPEAEFGIIAGASWDGDGLNPLLEGDDDGLLKLENVKTEKAGDVMTLENQHSLLLFDDRVSKAAVHFLEHGSFPERTK